jgi:hypothetical protein
MRQIVAPRSDLGESYDTVAAGVEMPAAVYYRIDSCYVVATRVEALREFLRKHAT